MERIVRNVPIVTIAVFVCFIGSSLAFESMARADEKEQARALLEDGDEYMDKGDRRRDKGRVARAKDYYQKALKAYEGAYQLVPKSTIFYAIASAEARLERYEAAIKHYQQVIAEVDKPQLQEMAKERIAELKPFVAAVRFNITPEGAELSINAELRGVAPFEQSLMFSPGTYTVTVTAEGYTPQEVELTFEAGRESTQNIALEEISVLVKKPQARDDDERLRVPGTRVPENPGKGRLILGSVTTVTLLLTAGVTGGLGLANDGEPDYPDRGLKIVGIVTGGLALLAGGYTAYHYLGVYRPRTKALERQALRDVGPKFWAAPYVHGSGGGVAVLGRF